MLFRSQVDDGVGRAAITLLCAVGGSTNTIIHLLALARRPLAVTDDLTSFWSGPYAQVRTEMRGRYPKHPWPEDPWSALATARASHDFISCDNSRCATS